MRFNTWVIGRIPMSCWTTWVADCLKFLPEFYSLICYDTWLFCRLLKDPLIPCLPNHPGQYQGLLHSVVTTLLQYRPKYSNSLGIHALITSFLQHQILCASSQFHNTCIMSSSFNLQLGHMAALEPFCSPDLYMQVERYDML